MPRPSVRDGPYRCVGAFEKNKTFARRKQLEQRLRKMPAVAKVLDAGLYRPMMSDSEED